MMVFRYHSPTTIITTITLIISSIIASTSSEECQTINNIPPLTPRNPPPLVSTPIFFNNKILSDMPSPLPSITKNTPIYGCCVTKELSSSSSSCPSTQQQRRTLLGSMPQYNSQHSLAILKHAQRAFDGGSGAWPQMSLKERVGCIQDFVKEVTRKREEIVEVLMWEIGKNYDDACMEFDRTMKFIDKLIETIHSHPEFNSKWQTIGSTHALVRRAAIGIILCLGPFNYPLNETYATLIPALLMGNVVIMKIPTVGGLVHFLTMEAFAKTLPPGVMNFISGSGRATMPPLMSTGHIDGLAFIGGSKAADDLIKEHPEPHRLKLFLQLEAKNMAIFTPNLFHPSNTSQLQHALDQTLLGSLSYNGQRCTALKIIFVPKSHSELVADQLSHKINDMRIGLPWDKFEEDKKYSMITPLPNQKRVNVMKQLIQDAVEKGASIVNTNGGTIIQTNNNNEEDEESTLMIPALLHPVTPSMDVYHQEQFGPVVPIVPYDDLSEVLEYGRLGKYGQQVSIFTSSRGNGEDEEEEGVARLIDRFSTVFGKINLNSQCARSPDTLPFSGRRSSAMGVMSVLDALREFSIPTVVAYKDGGVEEQDREGFLEGGVGKRSKFLESLD